MIRIYLYYPGSGSVICREYSFSGDVGSYSFLFSNLGTVGLRADFFFSNERLLFHVWRGGLNWTEVSIMCDHSGYSSGALRLHWKMI